MLRKLTLIPQDTHVSIVCNDTELFSFISPFIQILGGAKEHENVWKVVQSPKFERFWNQITLLKKVVHTDLIPKFHLMTIPELQLLGSIVSYQDEDFDSNEDKKQTNDLLWEFLALRKNVCFSEDKLRQICRFGFSDIIKQYLMIRDNTILINDTISLNKQVNGIYNGYCIEWSE